MIWLSVKLFLLREQLKTYLFYYRSPRFALADVLVGISSFFLNPYRTCRKHGGVYGETPLSTFERLARAASLQPTDTYVELGSGRGKTCLWASEFVGCRTIGVECVPRFVWLSRCVSWISGVPVEFQRESMFAADLSQATVVYLYAIHLSEEEMQRLTPVLLQMPSGGRLISISDPLDHPGFSQGKSRVARFPWGKTDAYVQIRL